MCDKSSMGKSRRIRFLAVEGKIDNKLCAPTDGGVINGKNGNFSIEGKIEKTLYRLTI